MPKLHSWRSPKTEIREDGVEGKGLFAVEDIAEGELVFIKGGHIVRYDECMRLAEKLGDYYLQIEDEFFLSAKSEEELKSTAIFINHSCSPNVGPDGQISFRAIKDIEAGEELCYDYAMTTAHPYQLECDCGAKNCRGVITGEDWKKEELQERYGDNFSDFILRKIEEEG